MPSSPARSLLHWPYARMASARFPAAAGASTSRCQPVSRIGSSCTTSRASCAASPCSPFADAVGARRQAPQRSFGMTSSVKRRIARSTSARGSIEPWSNQQMICESPNSSRAACSRSTTSAASPNTA